MPLNEKSNPSPPSAGDGREGGKSRMTGANGRDIVLKVPEGYAADEGVYKTLDTFSDVNVTLKKA